MKWPRPTLTDPRFRGFLAVGIVALLVVTLLWPFAFSRSERQLSAYASGDNDISQFHDELAGTGAHVESILSTAHLASGVDPSKTLLVVVGVERPYDATEAATVKQFVEDGGTLLIADDTGYGTQLTRDLAGLEVTSDHVLDTVDAGNVTHPVATARLGDQTYRVEFNVPSAIVELSSALPHDIIAQSSDAAYPNGSFLDIKHDGYIDKGDPPGPFQLAVDVPIGAHGGRLVLVSDTGVFQNRQMAHADYDNARFARALVDASLPSGGSILIDESRHPPEWWIAPYENAARALGRLTNGDTMPILVTLVLVAASLAAWRFTRQTEDWSHHGFDASQVLALPDTVRPDLSRAQRMARHRISERFNIPLEQVAAMTAEELLAATGDRALSEAAAGQYRGDPAPLFQSFSTPPESTP